MGANQSGGQKSRRQYAPDYAASSSSANGLAGNKNSFGRQQLNRLFRKSLPIQSRQTKCNADETRPEYNDCCPLPRGGSNRPRRAVLDSSQFSDPNQYYVSASRGERLVGASEPRRNNGQLDLHRETSTGAGTDTFIDYRAAAAPSNGPLGPSHQRSLQRQVRQQPPSAIEHHNNKSNMMTTTNKTPQSQQPLNNSNDRHQSHSSQHHAARQQHQYQQQQQQQLAQNQNQLQHQHQQQQKASANGVSRPSNKSGKAQQKSSCSPSSASAASSPTSSSSSAAGFSSSESLRLLRQQQLNALHPAKLMIGERESQREREWRQQQQQLVAAQLSHNQRHHRRAHSSGQPLSWSKQLQQQQQAASVISNEMQAMAQMRDQSQLMMASANQVEQTSRGQHRLVANHEHRVPGSRQMLSPDQYHQPPRGQSSNFSQATLDHADDPFYPGSARLVAVNPVSHEAQPYQLYPSGHLSAPVQRRNRWPVDQRRVLLDTSYASYVPVNDHQQQFYVSVPQHQQAFSQSAIYDDLEFMQTSNQQPASYCNQEPLGHFFDHQSPQAIQSNTLKSRSKSFGKSSSTSLSNKSPRLRNPLASLFSPADTKRQAPIGANTIHHFKSHQNLPNSSSTIARSASGGGASSLKRVKSSPLTTSSYEAMRAIDMYLIRQIARSCMDFEMEQKIDLEIRLREMAAQSLLEAQTEVDLLEVEKSLLTSDQRMNCYASQLEQKRKRLSNPSLATTDSGRGSKASHWDSSRTASRTNNAQTGVPNSSAGVASSRRADVIGPSGTNLDSAQQREFGSPGGSSYSKGSHQMSPVSNESANSKQSPPPPASSKTNSTSGSAASSSNEIDGGSKALHSWSSLSRSKHHVIRRPTSSADTLNRRRKSQRRQHLEQLAQMLAKLYNLDYIPAPDTKATISVSELRVPLMWRDVDHFKGRGEYRRFAVFCVAKIGPQIYDTQLISDVDRQMTDLTFDDVILFNNVELDFQLELEVYSCVYLEQFSLSNTPRKLMEKFSNSVGRAMGRRLATRTASLNYIKELEAYDKSYRFAMIASTKLTLVDASDSIKTYDLRLISPEAHGRHSTGRSQYLASNGAIRGQQAGSILSASGHGTQAMFNREHQSNGNHNGLLSTSTQRELLKNTLPLFGHFCCRVHVRP